MRRLGRAKRGASVQKRRRAPVATRRRQDIWFVVSVPVLSEQITVVQPSVSTLGSFLRGRQGFCKGISTLETLVLFS